MLIFCYAVYAAGFTDKNQKLRECLGANQTATDWHSHKSQSYSYSDSKNYLTTTETCIFVQKPAALFFDYNDWH